MIRNSKQKALDAADAKHFASIEGNMTRAEVDAQNERYLKENMAADHEQYPEGTVIEVAEDNGHYPRLFKRVWKDGHLVLLDEDEEEEVKNRDGRGKRTRKRKGKGKGKGTKKAKKAKKAIKAKK